MNLHSAFYKFVPIANPTQCAATLRAQTNALTGSIIVASEGVNGTVAGVSADVAAFEAALRSDPRFADMPFKHSGWESTPFGRMKVSVRARIVAIDLPAVPAAPRTALEPEAWARLITRDDVVVLDNRNHFEWALGRFEGALNPDVSHFKDFPTFVAAHADAWKRDGKTVAMYCTGGIRCERTSSWVQSLGLPCVELDGGILNFLEKMPASHSAWKGECYVFDNRVALDATLNETRTTATEVFAPFPDETWRIARAERLDAATQPLDEK